MRCFKGSLGAGSAALDVRSSYEQVDAGSISLNVRNVARSNARVTVLDAYTGEKVTRVVGPGEESEGTLSIGQYHGWYDLVVTVAEDPSFEYRLAGHVETGRDSKSDPAMGGLVSLKA
jgi:phospholipase C